MMKAASRDAFGYNNARNGFRTRTQNSEVYSIMFISPQRIVESSSRNYSVLEVRSKLEPLVNQYCLHPLLLALWWAIGPSLAKKMGNYSYTTQTDNRFVSL